MPPVAAYATRSFVGYQTQGLFGFVLAERSSRDAFTLFEGLSLP